jgi:hypothetical protein
MPHCTGCIVCHSQHKLSLVLLKGSSSWEIMAAPLDPMAGLMSCLGMCRCMRLQLPSVVAQMSQQGVERSVGDAVDAWNDGGWWVGHVTSAPAATDGAGAAAASPRRGSGRRKGNGPPAAQPPLRVLLAGSGEELLAQQVTHKRRKLWLVEKFVVVRNPISSLLDAFQDIRTSPAVHFVAMGVATYQCPSVRTSQRHQCLTG